MWIRSQDETVLLNLDNIIAILHKNCYEEFENHGPTHSIVAVTHGSENSNIEIGRYYTENRIFQVLDEIEDDITEDSCSIYYMPEK